MSHQNTMLSNRRQFHQTLPPPLQAGITNHATSLVPCLFLFPEAAAGPLFLSPVTSLKKVPAVSLSQAVRPALGCLSLGRLAGSRSTGPARLSQALSQAGTPGPQLTALAGPSTPPHWAPAHHHHLCPPQAGPSSSLPPQSPVQLSPPPHHPPAPTPPAPVGHWAPPHSSPSPCSTPPPLSDCLFPPPTVPHPTPPAPSQAVHPVPVPCSPLHPPLSVPPQFCTPVSAPKSPPTCSCSCPPVPSPVPPSWLFLFCSI
ncbi:uncharacterized protein LOC134209012 [Armigeres subalbatus]|uniref:uncharacterized protein LOC134209012 n=1 Tax=Armigeres subalbatus TaxID=124917 RepID=UPI002ECFD58D